MHTTELTGRGVYSETTLVEYQRYRIPGFLATSFSEDKAHEFLYRAVCATIR